MKKLSLALTALAVSAVATSALANTYVRFNPTTCGPLNVQGVYANATVSGKPVTLQKGSEGMGAKTLAANTFQLTAIAYTVDGKTAKVVPIASGTPHSSLNQQTSTAYFGITCQKNADGTVSITLESAGTSEPYAE